MPRLIKNGAIVEDQWLPLILTTGPASSQQILSLDQWLALDDKSGQRCNWSRVKHPPLFEHLAEIPLVAVQLPCIHRRPWVFLRPGTARARLSRRAARLWPVYSRPDDLPAPLWL